MSKTKLSEQIEREHAEALKSRRSGEHFIDIEAQLRAWRLAAKARAKALGLDVPPEYEDK